MQNPISKNLTFYYDQHPMVSIDFIQFITLYGIIEVSIIMKDLYLILLIFFMNKLKRNLMIF